jgi:hypothetical protein
MRPPHREKDIVRCQIHPRAHELLSVVGITVEPGFRKDDDGIERSAWGPNFPGIPDAKWSELLGRFPKAFWELEGICRADFPTWAALLGKVVPKGGGESHPFIFTTPQRVFWTNGICYCLENNLPLWIVCLKARQMTITTFVALWQYWQDWRKKNVKSLFLGDRVDLLQRQLEIVRACHEGMPNVGGLKPTLRADTKGNTGKVPKYELYMASRGGEEWNSGGMTAAAVKQNAALGAQATHVTCSEAAFWAGKGDIFQEILDALTPQLPGESSPNYLKGRSSLIVESTPQGMNDFRDLYWDAKDVGVSNDRTWHPIFLPWFIFEEGYFAKVPDGWEMSEEDRKEWTILCDLRKAHDGRPVTIEQMYWRFKMIRDKYKDAETFNEWYPRDDDTCFRAADGSVFKDDATYLENCVYAAEADGREKMFPEYNRLHPDAQIPNVNGVAQGDLLFDPMPAPFYYEMKVLSGPEKRESRWEPNPKGKIFIWEPPQPGHVYALGSDTSGGTGNDGACTHVACVTCGAQAAEMWSRYLDPTVFTDASAHLAWWYNTAIWNGEVNHLGAAALKRATFDWMYPLLAKDEAWDEARFKERKYWFSTGERTKPIMVTYGANLIKERHYRIASRRLKRELSRFYYLGLTSRLEERYAGGRTGKGSDDTVLAMFLALWAVRQCPPGVRADFEMRHARIPDAIDLGLNRTNPGAEFFGKGLLADQYGGVEVPEELANLFDLGVDEQLVSACPLGGSWSGMGLDL